MIHSINLVSLVWRPVIPQNQGGDITGILEIRDDSDLTYRLGWLDGGVAKCQRNETKSGRKISVGCWSNKISIMPFLCHS